MGDVAHARPGVAAFGEQPSRGSEDLVPRELRPPFPQARRVLRHGLAAPYLTAAPVYVTLFESLDTHTTKQEMSMLTTPKPATSTCTYPHTIDNGAGERLTFLRRVQDSAGDRLEVENLVKPGSGPPMHVHHYQEEALTVEQGKICLLYTSDAADEEDSVDLGG